MVTLTRIYTRGGDQGQTSLGDGSRVAKHALRVEAYGTVDEANATLGLVRLHNSGEHDAMLARMQNELFDLGADLCRPGADFDNPKRLRVTDGQVERLEREIDAMNASLEALTSFILPSGSAGVSALHLARAVTRRAERAAVALHEAEPLNPHLLAYINRLSDHLFVAARFVAAREGGDVLWQPGATRS